MSIRIKSQRTHRTVVKKTSGFLSIHFFFNCQAKSNQIWGSPSKGDQIENWVNLKKVDGWNSIAKKKHAHKKILIYVRTFRDSKVRVHRISKLVQFLLLKDLFLNLVSIQEVLTHCRWVFQRFCGWVCGNFPGGTSLKNFLMIFWDTEAALTHLFLGCTKLLGPSLKVGHLGVNCVENGGAVFFLFLGWGKCLRTLFLDNGMIFSGFMFWGGMKYLICFEKLTPRHTGWFF